MLELGFGQGEDVVMSSSYRTVARVPGGNGLHADLHDFQIAPHGIAYITAYNPIRCNLSPLEGARDGAIIDTAIQEIDMAHGAGALGMAQPRPHPRRAVGDPDGDQHAAVGLVSHQLDRRGGGGARSGTDLGAAGVRGRA